MVKIGPAVADLDYMNGQGAGPAAATARSAHERVVALRQLTQRRAVLREQALSKANDDEQLSAATYADAEVHRRAWELLSTRLSVLEYYESEHVADPHPFPLSRDVDLAFDEVTDVEHEIFGVAASLQSAATVATRDGSSGVAPIESLQRHGSLESCVESLARASAAIDVLHDELCNLRERGRDLLGVAEVGFDRWPTSFFVDWVYAKRLAAGVSFVSQQQDEFAALAARVEAIHASCHTSHHPSQHPSHHPSLTSAQSRHNS